MFIDEKEEKDTIQEFDEETNEFIIPEEDNDDETTGEETPEEETQETEETDDLPDKYKGKTAAEIARMHEEAEKLIGKQGAELGELRKKDPESDKPKTIENLSDAELNQVLTFTENKLQESGASLEDDYGKDVVLYNKLLAESNKRQTLSTATNQQVNSANEKVLADFKTTLGDAITFDQLTEIGRVAKKLSDDGKIGTPDMQTALLKCFPEVYQTVVIDKKKAVKTKEAQDTAKITGQPRVGTSGSSNSEHTGRYSAEALVKLQADDPRKFNEILRVMSPAQREKLKQQLKT
jgi:hypothetical protein